MTRHKVVKTHKAKLTPKSDTTAVTVEVDDSARLREIRAMVKANNHSTLDENLVICQIYMESRFDAHATPPNGSAKGLLQMTEDGVKQVYKYRVHKQLGHMPSNRQTEDAFAQGVAMHGSPGMFDEATNIQLGTEYMQYWIDISSSIEHAYKRYRGVANGIYYRKISACAAKLKDDPESMQPLRDMFK
ncbi:lysozyme family protein [Paraburkholderia oxyphila]|uniref:lytic transglycosylase domain-containing protein n=1 Tax=Paraburkholderia oxyphila TaxID=614212 RepID=UPI0009FCAEEF|nr:lytic transglycosylase domain-containing protein [Paraburkholderia oxyphila]